MSPIIDNFMERPWSHKIAFWLISIVIVGFVFWQYFYSEKHDQIGELSEKIEDLNTQITYERRLARNLKKVKEEVADLDEKLKLALQELPDEREIPDLLASISDLSRSTGLEEHMFKPGKESLKEFYAEVPVSISVEGTYHQVATFFDEVGQLKRIVNIHGITVRNPVVKPEKVSVKVDCTATTFRYLTADERKVQKKMTKSKRKKG